MDEENAFELTKREFAALYAFTGGPRVPAIPILFRPAVEEPKWPAKLASHIVATDGHTLVTHKDVPFRGPDFWIGRDVAALLKGAIPSKGRLLLAKEKNQIHFMIREGAIAKLWGLVEEGRPDEKFAAGYREFGEHKIPKKRGGKGALQTRYLNRLEAIRKAVGHCMGAEIFTGRNELDPCHFLFRNSGKLPSWHVAIMPYRQ